MKVTEKVLEDFYQAVASNSNEFAYRIHIPLSDVFYVREHLHQKFGERFTLDYVEWAMLKEGLIEARHCSNPEEKLSWREYPKEKTVNGT
jgi:hypothetical protein